MTGFAPIRSASVPQTGSSTTSAPSYNASSALRTKSDVTASSENLLRLAAMPQRRRDPSAAALVCTAAIGRSSDSAQEVAIIAYTLIVARTRTQATASRRDGENHPPRSGHFRRTRAFRAKRKRRCERPVLSGPDGRRRGAYALRPRSRAALRSLWSSKRVLVDASSGRSHPRDYPVTRQRQSRCAGRLDSGVRNADATAWSTRWFCWRGRRTWGRPKGSGRSLGVGISRRSLCGHGCRSRGLAAERSTGGRACVCLSGAAAIRARVAADSVASGRARTCTAASSRSRGPGCLLRR